MQRKKIDRSEYETIKAELADTVEIIGPVTTIERWQEDHGHVILIRQASRFFVDADDASMVRAKGKAQSEPSGTISPEARAIGIALGRTGRR